MPVRQNVLGRVAHGTSRPWDKLFMSMGQNVLGRVFHKAIFLWGEMSRSELFMGPDALERLVWKSGGGGGSVLTAWANTLISMAL
jgi:hypothetical protein